jgi:hypothetical protein
MSILRNGFGDPTMFCKVGEAGGGGKDSQIFEKQLRF